LACAHLDVKLESTLPKRHRRRAGTLRRSRWSSPTNREEHDNDDGDDDHDDHNGDDNDDNGGDHTAQYDTIRRGRGFGGLAAAPVGSRHNPRTDSAICRRG
jgi:hypothetical protein